MSRQSHPAVPKPTKDCAGFLPHGESDLLVPTLLKARIDREREQAAIEVALKRRAERDAELARGEAAESAVLAFAPPLDKKPVELVIPFERDILWRGDPEFSYNRVTQYRGYETLEPLALLGKVGTPDTAIHKRNQEIYQRLKVSGPVRKLASPTDDLKSLNDLRESQPHFGHVVDFVRSQIKLRQASGQGIHIPPMMLAGSAGLGKTHFAQKLADALGAPMRIVRMDSDVTNAVFLGSDKKWGNTTMGVLMELVVLGDFANPVVVLDEIDKTRSDRNGDPLASLHSLLEPASACKMRDISLDFEFDASRIIWIATANFLPRLSTPLRSRFREFWIEQPTGLQAIGLATSMVATMVEKLAPDGFELPGRAIVVKLAHLTAREVYQAMEEAIASAITNGRLHLITSDLPADVLDEDCNSSHLH
jgi:ATP-dependent Lon protease